MAERIFRLLSLGFLSIGFVVAVAGTEREGAAELANATSDLIQHVSAAQDANSVNAQAHTQSNKGISLTSETNYVAQAKVEGETARPASADAKAPIQALPPKAN